MKSKLGMQIISRNLCRYFLFKLLSKNVDNIKNEGLPENVLEKIGEKLNSIKPDKTHASLK
jgi:hypothetical protein